MVKNLSIIPKDIIEIKKLRHLEIKGNQKKCKIYTKKNLGIFNEN